MSGVRAGKSKSVTMAFSPKEDMSCVWIFIAEMKHKVSTAI